MTRKRSNPAQSRANAASAEESGNQFVRTGWNSRVKQVFMHPPVFSFSAVEKAASYRCAVNWKTGREQFQEVVESKIPCLPLESTWGRLPRSGKFQVTVEALDHGRKPLGEVKFEFRRKLPFEGIMLPQRLKYIDSGLRCAEFMMETLSGTRAELREYAVKPGGERGWPGLFYSAQIRLLVAYAKHSPSEKAGEAQRHARTFTDWLVERTSPSHWVWPHCPPTQGISHIKAFAGGLQPSRLGLLGEAFLDFLEVMKDKRLLDATMKMADTLKARQLPEGRWPFRVNAETGKIISDYTSDQIEIIMFLERLIEDYGRRDLQKTVDGAVQWTLENPCRDYLWQGQYDDMGGFAPYEGLEWYDTGFFILYLLRHAEETDGYLQIAGELMRYIDDQFIEWGLSREYVTPSAREQYNCYQFVDYSVAHYIRICIGFHRTTSDDTYLKKAQVMANTLTNLQHPDGWFACQHATHTAQAGEPGILGEVQFRAEFGINFLPNCSAYAAEMLIRLDDYLAQGKEAKRCIKNP